MQQSALEQRRLLLATVQRLQTFKGCLIAMGGGPDPLGLVLPEFVQLAGGSQARIAAVPVASYMRTMGDIYRDFLMEMGVREVWTVDPEGPQCNDPLVRPSLEAASGIAITGGDQKRLCRELNGTYTRECIIDCLQAGTPVFCTSASTVGLADRMIAGLDDHDRVLVEEGLSILPGFTIETHVTQRDRHGRLFELCERKANPVILGLDENTALFFIPNSSRAIVRGPGHVFVLCCHDQRRSRVLSHGDSIDLADLIPDADREWPDHNVLHFRARVADSFTRWRAVASSR